MISQSDLAKRWNCSQPNVSKLVKRGMPLDSVQAAEEWRAANAQRGFTPETAEPVPSRGTVKTVAWQYRTERSIFGLRCALLAANTLNGEAMEAMNALHDAFERVAKATGVAPLGEDVVMFPA